MPELVGQWERGVLMEQQRGGLLQSGDKGTPIFNYLGVIAF